VEQSLNVGEQVTRMMSNLTGFLRRLDACTAP
jgi:hypothetical protein